MGLHFSYRAFLALKCWRWV